MIVVGLATAAGDVVVVAGAVDAVDAAVGADADIEPELEFGFAVEVTMFGIEVVDELVVTKEEVGEETVDIANEVVVIEYAEEGPDTVVAVAVAVAVVAAAGAAGAGVAVVGIDAFARYIVDADIGEEAEDYVGVALEKRS